MPRFALLPILLCLVAPLTSGCQTAQQTARVERPRGDAFWSANGRSTTTLASRWGDTPFRFATRDSSDRSSGLLSSGGGKERIPLPRSQPGGLRGVDRQASSEQGIGAF